MAKKYNIEWKWALIFIFVALLWMGFEKMMGWHDELISQHPIYTNFFGIVAIIIYFLAIHDKRKNFYNGYMTWKQGFTTGFMISIIIALFSPLTQLITHKIISPNYFHNAIEYGVSMGKLDQETAEKFFSLKSYILNAVVFSLGSGIVTSALVALFLQKKLKS